MNPASLVLVSSFHQALRPLPAPRRELRVSFTRRGSEVVRTPQSGTKLKHRSGGDSISPCISLSISPHDCFSVFFISPFIHRPFILVRSMSILSFIFLSHPVPPHRPPLPPPSCSLSLLSSLFIIVPPSCPIHVLLMFIVTYITFPPSFPPSSFPPSLPLSSTCTSPLHRSLYLPFNQLLLSPARPFTHTHIFSPTFHRPPRSLRATCGHFSSVQQPSDPTPRPPVPATCSLL